MSNSTMAGPTKIATVSGRWNRPVARPARKKMSSRAAKKTTTADTTWPSLPTESENVDAVSNACDADTLTPIHMPGSGETHDAGTRRKPWPGGYSFRATASPSQRDNLLRGWPRGVDGLRHAGDRRTGSEPCRHLRPLGARTNGRRHQVRCVEPEGRGRVREVLRGQLVNAVAVQALVDSAVRGNPAWCNLDPAVGPLR